MPLLGGEVMQEELNKFLRSQRVLQVEHRLVQDGGASYWSFCIKYLDGKSGALKGRSNRIEANVYEAFPDSKERPARYLRCAV